MNIGRRQAGFTLIEVLIVVAVVAILSAIALPNYSEYVRRTHRSNAKSALMQASQWMERAATAQGAYPLTNAVPAGVLVVQGERYIITAESDGTTYTLTATPQGGQQADACGTLTVNQSGTRARSGAAPLAECWGR